AAARLAPPLSHTAGHAVVPDGDVTGSEMRAECPRRVPGVLLPSSGPPPVSSARSVELQGSLMSQKPTADPPDPPSNGRGPHEPPSPAGRAGDSLPAPRVGLWAIPALPAAARPSALAVLDQMRLLGLLDGERLTQAEALSRTMDAEPLCRELLRRGWLT